MDGAGSTGACVHGRHESNFGVGDLGSVGPEIFGMGYVGGVV